MGMKGFAPKNHNIPEGDFEDTVLPAGQYLAMIQSIEFGQTKTTNRDYELYKWKIVEEGEYQNVVISQFEYPPTSDEDQSQQAQIWRKKLKSLMSLCGCGDVLNDEKELIGHVLVINNKPYTDRNGTTRNSINYYLREKKGGGVVASAPPGVAPASAPKAAPAVTAAAAPSAPVAAPPTQAPAPVAAAAPPAQPPAQAQAPAPAQESMVDEEGLPF